jgi:hypothetical protein
VRRSTRHATAERIPLSAQLKNAHWAYSPNAYIARRPQWDGAGGEDSPVKAERALEGVLAMMHGLGIAAGDENAEGTIREP